VSDDGLMQILSTQSSTSLPEFDSSISDKLEEVIVEISDALNSVTIDQGICILLRDMRTFLRDELDIYVYLHGSLTLLTSAQKAGGIGGDKGVTGGGSTMSMASTSSSSRPRLLLHNSYAEQWAKVNHETITDAGREGDGFFIINCASVDILLHVRRVPSSSCCWTTTTTMLMTTMSTRRYHYCCC